LSRSLSFLIICSLACAPTRVSVLFVNRIVRKVKKEIARPSSREASLFLYYKTVRPAIVRRSKRRLSVRLQGKFHCSFIIRLFVWLQGKLHCSFTIRLSVRLQGKLHCSFTIRLSVRLQGKLHCSFTICNVLARSYEDHLHKDHVPKPLCKLDYF